MLIWGRANSVNVQKVVWCCEELGLAYVRRDAGGAFGIVDTAEYRALNPNGRVPTLVDGTFVLWESNAILRYLASKAGSGLYPSGLQVRAGIERWLDWQLSTLQPAERPVFWGLVRTPPEERDMNAIRAGVQNVGRLWEMLDGHLTGRDYLEGERFSLADLVLGAYVHRWYGLEGIERPDTPHLRRWYDRLRERDAYRRHVAIPLT